MFLFCEIENLFKLESLTLEVLLSRKLGADYAVSVLLIVLLNFFQEFASSSTDASKTPEAVVSSNSGHFFGNDELSTSIKMNGDASHNGSSSYSAPIPQNIHPMFVPHTPSLPPPAARVEMPQPDYDDPLPNGVLSNGGAVVFDSPDATSSYNGQVAVEASHLKSAKQVRLSSLYFCVLFR